MPAPSFPTAGRIGNYGECVAAAFLRRRGYRVLTRNFKAGKSEIDLVCRLGSVLIFVEVKTRADVDWLPPSAAIGPSQEKALDRAAHRYLELLGRDDIAWRFDAVEVHLQPGKIPVCTLIPNFFGAGVLSEGNSRG